jgi:RNA polymerase sigma-70 factor, ECF subfamily
MPAPAHELRELLRACRLGDEVAARSLHARTAPALHAYARSILRRDDLANDAVQSAFCRVFRTDPDRIAGVEDPAAYLASLVRGEALTWIRAKRRSSRREQAQRPVNDQKNALSSDELHAAIEALPRPLREIVALRHVAGMTYDQIGVALDQNRNTVAARHRRALELLRTALTPIDTEAHAHAR